MELGSDSDFYSSFFQVFDNEGRHFVVRNDLIDCFQTAYFSETSATELGGICQDDGFLGCLYLARFRLASNKLVVVRP